MLEKPTDANPTEVVSGASDANPAGISVLACVSWIASRQTTYLEEVESEDPGSLPASEHEIPNSDPSNESSSNAGVLSFSEEDLRCVGFNGRANKVADTCYCFWNTAALEVVVPQIPVIASSG